MASKWTRVSGPVRIGGMENISSGAVVALHTSKTASGRSTPPPSEAATVISLNDFKHWD